MTDESVGLIRQCRDLFLFYLFIFFAILTLKWKRGAVKKYVLCCPWRKQVWNGQSMAHADFRGTPTYFAVIKMIISGKYVNQNMLKISLIFWKNL